jgi:GGDEF domain-containing protein
MDPSSEQGADDSRQGRDSVALSGVSLEDAGAALPPRFERQLRGAARRRRGAESPWVAIAKVDGVTRIRTEHGDTVAEEFLRSTASVLRSSLRESDKLAPVGRGEYGIILDAPNGGDAVAGLERLVQNVRDLTGRDGRWGVGSLSVGVAALRTDEPVAILELARAALELASQAGSWQVVMSAEAS